jgi:hypothetical protein
VRGMQRSGGGARPVVAHGSGLALSVMPAADTPSVAAAGIALDSCNGPACTLAVSNTLVAITVSVQTLGCQEIARR